MHVLEKEKKKKKRFKDFYSPVCSHTHCINPSHWEELLLMTHSWVTLLCHKASLECPGKILWWYQYHRLTRTREKNKNFLVSEQELWRLEIPGCFYNGEILAAVNAEALILGLLRKWVVLFATLCQKLQRGLRPRQVHPWFFGI